MENQNINDVENTKQVQTESISISENEIEQREKNLQEKKEEIRNRPPRKFTKKDLIRNIIIYSCVAVIAFIVYYFFGPFKTISKVANGFIAFGVCVLVGVYSVCVEYFLAKKSMKKEDK